MSRSVTEQLSETFVSGSQVWMGSSRILVSKEQQFKQPFFSHFTGVYVLSSPDTSKLQVYLCAPRTVEHDRWLPRVTLRTKLDKVMQERLGQNISPRGKRFHNSTSNNNNVERRIDGLRITSAAGNRPLALRPKNAEAQESQELDEEGGENIWFQWDGKLSGIPVEP